jgi:hypothetical protein
VGVWFPGSDNNGVVGKGGDGESRAEWHHSSAVVGRGDDVSHRPIARRVTTACVVRGVEVMAAAAQLSRARDASVRAPFKWPLSLTGGLQRCLFIYQDFQTPQFDIRIGDLLDVRNSPNFS